MTMWQRTVAGTIAVAALSSNASAQERLETFTLVDGHVRLVELDATASDFGRILSIQSLPQGAYPGQTFAFGGASPVVAVAGGRYLVWTTAFVMPGFGGTLLALDRRTRQVIDASSALPRDGTACRCQECAS